MKLTRRRVIVFLAVLLFAGLAWFAVSLYFDPISNPERFRNMTRHEVEQILGPCQMRYGNSGPKQTSIWFCRNGELFLRFDEVGRVNRYRGRFLWPDQSHSQVVCRPIRLVSDLHRITSFVVQDSDLVCKSDSMCKAMCHCFAKCCITKLWC